jgi:hypothetical protein
MRAIAAIPLWFTISSAKGTPENEQPAAASDREPVARDLG